MRFLYWRSINRITSFTSIPKGYSLISISYTSFQNSFLQLEHEGPLDCILSTQEEMMGSEFGLEHSDFLHPKYNFPNSFQEILFEIPLWNMLQQLYVQNQETKK